MVPSGWVPGKTRDIANGLMGYAFKSSDFVESGTPLLRMGNLYQNKFDLTRSPSFLPDTFKDAYQKFVIVPGDLVMSLTGTMGKRDYGFTVCVPKGAPECLLNQRVMKLLPRPTADKLFVLYLMRSELILSQMYSFPGGTKQANLSQDQILNLPIMIPPLQEQKKIAQILSTWDKAIETVSKLIENSQKQKKSLMQNLLTGKKRLPGFSGEWKKGRLSSLCSIEKGVQKNKDTLDQSGNYPVINGGIQPSGYSDKYNTEAYTITISEGGNSCGFVGLIDVPFWCGGHCYALKNLKLDRMFLYQTLKNVEAEIMKLRVGSGLPNIQKKDLSNVDVYFPAINEQQKIASMLESQDNLIKAQRNILICLNKEKKSLMQNLLTGKVRTISTHPDE